MKLFLRIFTIIPFFWLITLFVIPLFFILKISFSDYQVSIPPYTPQLDTSLGWAGFLDYISKLDLETYRFLFSDSLYVNAIISSIQIAFTATCITLLFGYPVAYAMTKAPNNWRVYLMIAITLPFTTSFIIRIYSIIGILSNEGHLNNLLIWLGVIEEPLVLLNTRISIYVGILYSYLPFMVLPIYANLENMDKALIESAQDLGCSRIKAFWLVTFPLSKPGILAGCFVCFIPALGEFLIPNLLGGSATLMLGAVLWDEFFLNRDWPIAASLAVMLFILVMTPIVVILRKQSKNARGKNG